ncbi:hypothetical protein [Virgibacillus kimchii]
MSNLNNCVTDIEEKQEKNTEYQIKKELKQDYPILRCKYCDKLKPIVAMNMCDDCNWELYIDECMEEIEKQEREELERMEC